MTPEQPHPEEATEIPAAATTQREVASIDDLKDSFGEFNDDQLKGQVGLLTDGFNKIQDFDPANPIHMELRNRMLAAQQLAGDRGLLGKADQEDSTSGSNKPTDTAPPRLALRVDGGVDAVNADGAKQINRGDAPAPGNIIDQASPSSPSPTEAPPKRSIPLDTKSQRSGRRVILD
jgi:hypothetical protein